MVYVLKHGFDPLDPATFSNPAAVFIQGDKLYQFADGSVGIKLADGTYAGQEPNAYGVRNDNADAQAYQRFTKDGSLLSTVTRPGDQMFTYLIVQGRPYLA